MNTNEPLDADPNNNDKNDNDIPSMLGQMAFGFGLLTLLGLSVSHCAKKAIEDGYIGSNAKQQQELLHTLDNQKHAATIVDF